MEQETESDWINVSYKKRKLNNSIQNIVKKDEKKDKEVKEKNNIKQLTLDDYEIIDVRKKKFESVPCLGLNCVNFVATNYDFRIKEKPILVKQYENYSTPLTFDLVRVGNYYIVRDKPEYWNSTYESIVMQCIGKEIDVNGVQLITYQMISNPDHYLELKYIVTKSDEFNPKKFRRLPHDFWTNFIKYEKQIHKEFYIDHVELTGIY